MPSRGQSATQQATKTRDQIAQHFKSVDLRKAEFKTAKSALIEKELQVHFKAEHEKKRAEAAEYTRKTIVPRSTQAGSSPRASRPSSAVRGHSPKPGSPSMNRSMSSPDANIGSESRPMTPTGAVVNRFGASYPMSSHPSIHPGATSSRPSSRISIAPGGSADAGELLPRASSASALLNSVAFASPLAQRLPGSNLKRLSLPGKEAPSDMDSSEHQGDSADRSPAARPRSRTRTDSSSLFAAGSPCSPSAAAASSPTAVRRTMPCSRTAALLGMSGVNFAGASHVQDFEEPLFGEETSREEQLFEAAEKEAAKLAELAQSGVMSKRQPDAPDMIERLGGLMALLGPRYRTVPRQALWEKAVLGETTSLYRLEQRLGRDAAHSISGFKRGRVRRSSTKKVQPEDIPSYDSDGVARAAWLHARALEKEREARGIVSVPGPRVRATSAGGLLAPSVNLSMTEL
eukprot:TRINITY_DN24057_c0_g1_i1.p1 TRINITY_DN24057_c0_g1~~TRINITY_DN24057_c0_g1_i1.p1  ORF type:complete len:460 (+),score=90.07 TRINITY_DN24057_c0_g1_i1:137-1516(+)